MLKKRLVAACMLVAAIVVTYVMAPAVERPVGPADDLGGITFRSDRFPSGTVTLKNGVYRQPAASGSADELVVKLTDRRAFGVVHGRDAAVVVFVTDAGGSGTFLDMALLFKRNGGWVNVDTVQLGDRIKVHSIDIRENAILLRMTTHGPGDPMCCPTQEKTQSFAIQADRLVAREGETKTISSTDEIVGPVWHWVRTRYADDTSQRPAAGAAGYTLQLRPDGTIHVRGDCNVGGGSFAMKSPDLAIAITHSTRAYCPEGSLEDVFIRDLNRTVRFLHKNERLFLDLKLDSGTMEFKE